MRLSEEQYELIEAYLTGELSEKDKAAFENDMKTDAKLAGEVSRQRELRLGLRALGIERVLKRAQADYKASVASDMSGVDNQVILRPLLNWRYWAVAASVAVLLSIGYYSYQVRADREAELAYNEAFTPESGDEFLKGFPSGNRSKTARKQLLDALASYKAGKYDQVIEKLITMPVDKQTIYYKNYLLGLSYLANNQALESISLLKMAMQAPDAKLQQKAEWILALAYVKSNENELAEPILSKISNDEANPFRSLAQKVLKKIN
ncbi:hypothetical protein WBJ53_02250 [Spirosoma sp. SC4-14]|uniref:anti-sigma factor family protein n=1 Tax=Spirosoma sp. SC4-14 TaxID=3128900 RepID=UPI0030D031BF